MGQATQMLFPTVVTTTLTIPDGFTFATITPVSTGTYTISNSSGIAGLATSPTISSTFSFAPNNNISGYAAHTVTVVSGSVIVAYF